MCGRYALALRPSAIRHQLEQAGMPVYEAPDDDDTRQSYNVAPGYYEPIYRADVPDWGAGGGHQREERAHEQEGNDEGEAQRSQEEDDGKEVRYKLQAMKWGLIPFWTKRNPDYGSMLKTINCRDDSLKENRGMWNTMKQRKRCIVLCQGFYEWLKKNGGKEKVPHFVRRKDGQLMCFAGLWDCAQYEGSDEKLYTYTIITTDSNEQLKFLHDRMPVLLDNGSDAIRTWLDPKRSTWSAELQSLLKPYKGELEVYPVSKDVGKVGNNSPTFIVPISSSENKNNIANFFAGAKGKAKGEEAKKVIAKEEDDAQATAGKIKHDPLEERSTAEGQLSENSAPLPVPSAEEVHAGQKRAHDDIKEEDEPAAKSQKSTHSTAKDEKPPKNATTTSRRQTRSATSNQIPEKTTRTSPRKSDRGSQKITGFLTK